jgi:hypothetical protein
MNLKREYIKYDSQCQACKLFETCFSEQNRCWVDIVKAYGNDNRDFPDPRCAYAPQMNNELNFSKMSIKKMLLPKFGSYANIP